MMEDEDLPSDTDDEDYLPSDGEALSEEEGSGDEELPLLDDTTPDGESLNKPGRGKKKQGKRKTEQALASRKRQGGIQLEESEEAATAADGEAPGEVDDYNKQLGEQLQKERAEKKQEEEKVKADSLWADFMKDTGTPPAKPKPKTSAGLGALTKPLLTQKSSASPARGSTQGGSKTTDLFSISGSSTPQSGKVTITTEYDFAGETVKVTKQVDADSKEAKAELKKQEKSSEETDAKTSKAGPSLANLKRPAAGGLGSVLGMIGKKQKISTLEKSKLDWESFKQKEGINAELQIHNRGKDSYLERVAFLDRTDHRQFEIEKNLRLTNTKR